MPEEELIEDGPVATNARDVDCPSCGSDVANMYDLVKDGKFIAELTVCAACGLELRETPDGV